MADDHIGGFPQMIDHHAASTGYIAGTGTGPAPINNSGSAGKSWVTDGICGRGILELGALITTTP
jgi:hypothetical protein